MSAESANGVTSPGPLEPQTPEQFGHVLTEAQEAQARLYRRFCITRIDFQETRDTLDELLRLRLPLPRRSLPSPLLQALTTALIVSYARPFVPSRGLSIAEKAVPGSLLRRLTADERKSHDLMIDLRNREVAHSDADRLEITIRAFPGGDFFVLRTTRAPFLRKDLQHLRRIVVKLEKELDLQCEALRSELPHHVYL